MFFSLKKKEIALLKKIKKSNPIIHFITNYVTVNACANITLAVGGSPIMADEYDEVSDIVKLSSALVLNIGTINKTTLKSMIKAGKEANNVGIPVILDPCGIGATSFRKQAVKEILDAVKITVIKGNYGEIKDVCNLFNDNDTELVKSKGVDNCFKSSFTEMMMLAKRCAKYLGCIACATGKTDIISDGNDVVLCKYGNKIMTKITGCGCMLNGVIACACAVEKNFLQATHLACCIFEKKYKKFLASYIKIAE